MDVNHVIIQGLTPSEHYAIFNSTASKFVEVESVRGARKLPASLPLSMARTGVQWPATFCCLVQYLQTSKSLYQANLGIAENLIYPLVRYAWERVRRSLERQPKSFLSEKSKSSLKQSLLSRLSFTAKDAVEWIWQVFLNTPGLADCSNSNPHQYVVSRVFADGVEPWTLRLLHHFPALARLWSIQTMNWIAFTKDFLKQARTFALIQRKLSATSAKIMSLDMDLSDLRSKSRSVMRVRFADGTVWFYKPRSGKHEEIWFTLLRWINDQGFPAAFAIIETITNKQYSWMRAVAHKRCVNEKEAARYYFRAGALVYLIHWLRGVDFHAGNIIAHGTQPVIVDCETLLHPETRVPDRFQKQEGSLVRTAMLPDRLAADLRLHDSVTAFGRRSFGSHTVRVNGRNVSTAEFLDAMADGFKAMHTFLTKRSRSKQLIRICERLRRIPVRYIHRPTASYYAILESSLSVQALRSGFDRSAVLRTACQMRGRRKRDIKQEIAALESADIPVFHGRAVRPRGCASAAVTRHVAFLRNAFVCVPRRPKKKRTSSPPAVGGTAATCTSKFRSHQRRHQRSTVSLDLEERL